MAKKNRANNKKAREEQLNGQNFINLENQNQNQNQNKNAKNQSLENKNIQSFE